MNDPIVIVAAARTPMGALGGELAALYSFVFLYLACAGGGVWSADAARSKA